MEELHIKNKPCLRSTADLLSFFKRQMPLLRIFLIHLPVAFLTCYMFLAPPVMAQPWDVPYVPTPYDVVDQMLDLAEVGPGDYVIDLGSGDGRIVIGAILRGAYGHGIDIDPARIREAGSNAREAGLENRLLFIEGNIFDADISRASVITLYLLNSINMKLRPVLLNTLKPGSRVISHVFDMNEWMPDKVITADNDPVYLWIIPARVAGLWTWKTGQYVCSMNVQQEFQKIALKVSAGNTPLAVDNPFLSGERISFRATRPNSGEIFLYSGYVNEDKITGTVQIHHPDSQTVENWNATRK